MGDVTKEGEWDAFLQPPEGALPTSGVGDEGGMGLGVCLLSAAAAAKWLQSCLTLCDPIDGSPPGSFPGILQARTLECLQGSHLTGFCSPHSHCFPVICPSGCSVPG